MEQYIPKSALVAEIEKRKSQFMSQADNFHSLGMEEKRDHFAVLASNMHSILSFIDTLEVKEVGLEEKATQLSQKYFPDEENIWARPNIEAQRCKSACIEMVEWLKTQKGE